MHRWIFLQKIAFIFWRWYFRILLNDNLFLIHITDYLISHLLDILTKTLLYNATFGHLLLKTRVVVTFELFEAFTRQTLISTVSVIEQVEQGNAQHVINFMRQIFLRLIPSYLWELESVMQIGHLFDSYDFFDRHGLHRNLIW